jgi:hypothetical protein
MRLKRKWKTVENVNDLNSNVFSKFFVKMFANFLNHERLTTAKTNSIT